MTLENLKINKQLHTTLAEAGIVEAREIQEKSFSRILGGQDLICVGPEGCGKTTTLVMAVISRLKYAFEEAPRALILVPDKEKISTLLEQFNQLSRGTDLRVVALFPGGGIEGQRDEIADGVDVVISTPDRVLFIYQKSGINLNKLKMFVLDDAELIIKQGLQTPIITISESLPKCQHLAFSEVMHSKLEKLLERFMIYPSLLEIDMEETAGDTIDVVDQLLYRVPNYKTKLNLLNLLLGDSDQFPKVLVFANTRTTAENLSKSLNRRIPGEVGMLDTMMSDYVVFDSMEDFKNSDTRVLVMANEETSEVDLDGIPCILHFDLPVEKTRVVERIKVREGHESVLSMFFSTDIELSQVRKIEKMVGKKFPEEPLPAGLIIEGDPHSKEKGEELPDEGKEKTEPEKGSAFHEKKAANAKNYNYSYKDKLKMNQKKKGKKW